MKPVASRRLLLLGFGTVGKELARLLLARKDWLGSQGLAFPVTGILTRTRGLLADPAGLDLKEALEWAAAPSPGGVGPVPSGPPGPGAASGAALAIDLVREFPADIVVELTPLRVDARGEPAVSHVRAALAAGRHVVTANKGPVAWAFRELSALARAKGRRFLFESTVMDGTPVFSLARRTLSGCRLLACRGVVNSTTNYVLGRIAQGLTLTEAVKEAQAGGFAEADPSLDLEGWDAAVKIACLANVLLGLEVRPEQVDRTGITGITAEDLAREARRGRVVKLVAAAARPGSEGLVGLDRPVCPADTVGSASRERRFPARVGPEALPAGDILALTEGTSSALTLYTDLMGPITVFEHSPVPAQTAYGVFRDLLEIAEADSGTEIAEVD